MKQKCLRIRISEEEKERIKKKAELLDMTVSEYTRFVALNAKVNVILEVEDDISS